MALEVHLTPSTVSEETIRGRHAIIIDVLRATSTIAVALSNGARGVIAVPDMESASRITANLDSSAYLLAGEKEGHRIDGCAAGNSPSEYDKEVVDGRLIILKTTNGTDAVLACASADRLTTGSFLNLSSAISFAAEFLDETSLVCSGWHGVPSLEDTLCAGAIIHELPDAAVQTDGAKLALSTYHEYRENIVEAMAQSEHGRRLESIGAGSDIELVSARDVADIQPLLVDGVIAL